MLGFVIKDIDLVNYKKGGYIMSEEKKARQPRRDKKTVLQGKIEAVDNKIADLMGKIDALNAEKEKLTQELNSIKDEAAKEAAAKEQKAIMKLIKQKGLSLEELTNLLGE